MKTNKIVHCFPWQAAALHERGTSISAMCGFRPAAKKSLERNKTATQCLDCLDAIANGKGPPHESKAAQLPAHTLEKKAK